MLIVTRVKFTLPIDMWTEQQTDDIHRPMFSNDAGWILHFWRGQNACWRIGRPDGFIWQRNQTITSEQIDAAKAWATDQLAKSQIQISA